MKSLIIAASLTLGIIPSIPEQYTIPETTNVQVTTTKIRTGFVKVGYRGAYMAAPKCQCMVSCEPPGAGRILYPCDAVCGVDIDDDGRSLVTKDFVVFWVQRFSDMAFVDRPIHVVCEGFPTRFVEYVK